jgi:hypothetical protein
LYTMELGFAFLAALIAAVYWVGRGGDRKEVREKEREGVGEEVCT